MRYLILSDIHANLEALEAVLAAAPRATFERLLVLGDLVGYGANPNEVVDRLVALQPDVMIRGNHDKVSAGLEDSEGFNYIAAEAARWTFDTLTADRRARIAGLPAGPTLVDDRIEICHGTPYDEDAYVFDRLDAVRAFKSATRPICFFGHTHVAVAFALGPNGLDVTAPDLDDVKVVPIAADRRYLINPGSVGQPRDGDPRAAYATFDARRNEVRLCRVAYRVDIAQRKIAAAGLPEALAHRLAMGR